MDPAREEALTLPPEFVWLPRPKFRDRRWVHALLFLATILTTTAVGAAHYGSFATDFGATRVSLGYAELALRGFWYSGTILAILGCHELGHYFACRYYDVDASLPFFLPAPLPLTGTLGAFIRIREPIPSKRMLFDIGIAGPIAGFVVAVPALFLGLWMSVIASRLGERPRTILDLGCGTGRFSAGLQATLVATVLCPCSVRRVCPPAASHSRIALS